MKRPVLKTVLLVAFILALLAPIVTYAAVISAIMSSDQQRYRDAHRAFVMAMAMRGYAPPATEITLQTLNPYALSKTNTIRKFNAYRPDLIVAYGAPAAMAASQEAEGIPVVSADVFAAEQSQKGMCGVSSRVPMITLLKTVQGIRPYRRLGVLYMPREPGSQHQMDDIKRYAGQLGMTVLEGSVTSAATLDTALNSLLDKAEVLVVAEGELISNQFVRIVAKAKVKNIPVVSTMPEAAEKGALVSLEINPEEQGQLAAEIATRILEGAKTEHLSMISPHRIDLVINVRAARELSIEVPAAVRGNASRLIK